MTPNLYNRIESDKLIARYGAVPPPWTIHGGAHPFDICWRMGGDTYLEIFWEWWGKNKEELDLDQRIDYFRLWPPPAAWLTFMINAIWDLRSGKKEDKRPPGFDRWDEEHEQPAKEEEEEEGEEDGEEEEGWIEPEGFNYTPYFERIEALGFGTQQDFEEAFSQ